MHTILKYFQVIPMHTAHMILNSSEDWVAYLDIWEKLPPDVKRVGERVGVEERFLVRAMRGTANLQVAAQVNLLSIHQRFYITLALNDLVNEVPLYKVAKKYNCTKGMLQGLQVKISLTLFLIWLSSNISQFLFYL